jgi:HTH-type transcriptional regulator / antitoxin HigA
VLTTLVEAYERAHFPTDLPDAVDTIKFWMEQLGLTVKDLEPVIGRKNRVYEVLSRRRALTLRMIEGVQSLGFWLKVSSNGARCFFGKTASQR